MALTPLRRTYGISDAALVDLGQTVHAALVRDLADFAQYGIAATNATALLEQINDFFAFPKDEYYAGIMMEATVLKNNAITAMSEAAEGIVRRAIFKYGKGSAEVASFGWEGYANKREAEKLSVCNLVSQTATRKLTDMADTGLTAVIIADLDSLVTAARTQVAAKKATVEQRDQKVQERIGLGNDLYKQIAKYAELGKDHWENIDEAKYNDYVLYSGPAVDTATGTLVAGMIVQPSVTVDSGSNNIRITNSGPAPLLAYCADDPTDAPTATAQSIAAGETKTFSATDLGWSTTLNRLLLANTSASESAGYEVVVG